MSWHGARLGAGTLAALWAIGACGATPPPASAETGKSLPVPPIWSPDEATSRWFSVKQACELLKGLDPDGAADKGERIKALEKVKLGGLGLERLDCDGLSGRTTRGDLETASVQFTNLKDSVSAAIEAVNSLKKRCESDPRNPACVRLAVAAAPAGAPGSDRIAGVSSEEDDRDLDSGPRFADPEKPKPADRASPESRFVEGLTDFVLDRAKLEAIAYFEERFHLTLCVAERPRVLYFQAVCSVLASARSAGFSLATASRELRAAARRDLRALPDNALHQQYIRTGESLYVMSRVWLGLAARLRNASLEARQVFAAMGNVSAEICERQRTWGYAEESSKRFPQQAGKPAAMNEKIESDCKERLRALKLAGSLLNAGMLTGADKNGTRADLADAILLAYQLSPAAETGVAAVDFSGAFLDALSALQGVADRIGRLKTELVEIEKTLAAVRSEQGAKRAQELQRLGPQLTRFADLVVALIETSVVALEVCGTANCGIDGKDIRDKVTASTRTIRGYSRLARNVLEDRWIVVAVEISERYLSDRGEPGEAADLAHRYAPVITELASAETSVEVQKILSSAAAPAGSYREKFRGNTRSITAFVGVSAGHEKYRSSQVSGTGTTYGPFGPIGIHVTTPIRKPLGSFGGAVGAFVSILDLGPYASYREKADSVDKQPNIGWKQLFSPGGYLTYNISWEGNRAGLARDWLNKSPWVVGFGVSRTPSLLQTPTGESASSTRYQVFFALDLTLFPF